MKLEGLHHITAITGDAPRNVDFYARLLGLRMVKKSVNQDDPTVYHLFYADESGSPGSDLTFFEYPNARPGQAGAGMVHRIAHRVASAESLAFWADRLGGEGVATELVDGALRFDDPEGLSHELVVVDVPDAPLMARSTEVPDEHALQGFHAVYAGVADTRRSSALLTDVLGTTPVGSDSSFEVRGDRRGTFIHLEGGAGPGFGGAGTVHHIAWGTNLDEHAAWREQVAAAGLRITPVIDRFYFRSVYFREPGGILYELATIGPGFTTDEALETLGEHLALPPDFEHLRAQVEPLLTPLPDIRQWRPAPAPTS
jgi:glyoxalase family protein